MQRRMFSELFVSTDERLREARLRPSPSSSSPSPKSLQLTSPATEAVVMPKFYESLNRDSAEGTETPSSIYNELPEIQNSLKQDFDQDGYLKLSDEWFVRKTIIVNSVIRSLNRQSLRNQYATLRLELCTISKLNIFLRGITIIEDN